MLHGAYSAIMQDEDGQILEAHSVSAGLDEGSVLALASGPAAQAATACAAAWSSTAVYTAGNQASENGINYTANWWTQGNDPATSNGGSGSGEPWTSDGSCTGGSGGGGGGAQPRGCGEVGVLDACLVGAADVRRCVPAAPRDRAGVNIAVVDVPAFLAGFGRSAAGEFGHAGIEARSRAAGKSPLRNVWFPQCWTGGRLEVISPATSP